MEPQENTPLPTNTPTNPPETPPTVPPEALPVEPSAVPQTPTPAPEHLQTIVPPQTLPTVPVAASMTAPTDTPPPAASGTPLPEQPVRQHAWLTPLLIGGFVLLAGSAVAYYFFMSQSSMTTSGITLAEPVATTTQSIDPNLRPALEAVIQAQSTALATGNYDAFIATVDTNTSATIKKEEFEDEEMKELLKNMAINLSQASFYDAAQDGNVAGYYFTTEETAGGETKNRYVTVVKFAKENDQWKIAKIYTTAIDPNTDIKTVISTDANLAYVDMSDSADITIGYSSEFVEYSLKINGKVVENIDTENVWGSSAGAENGFIPINKYLQIGENKLEFTVLSPVTENSSVDIAVRFDNKETSLFKVDLSGDKVQTHTFTVSEGTQLQAQKSIFDGSFSN